MRFEWSEWKAEENLRKHGVDFEIAKKIFDDPLATSRRDLFGSEQRWQTFGRVPGFPMFIVSHTSRYDGVIEIVRIISARNAEPKEIRRYGRSNRSS